MNVFLTVPTKVQRVPVCKISRYFLISCTTAINTCCGVLTYRLQWLCKPVCITVETVDVTLNSGFSPASGYVLDTRNVQNDCCSDDCSPLLSFVFSGSGAVFIMVGFVDADIVTIVYQS